MSKIQINKIAPGGCFYIRRDTIALIPSPGALLYIPLLAVLLYKLFDSIQIAKVIIPFTNIKILNFFGFGFLIPIKYATLKYRILGLLTYLIVELI